MKDRNTLILCRRIMPIVLCAFISFAYMPVYSFAAGDKTEDKDTVIAVEKIEEAGELEHPNVEATDNDELLMQYLKRGVREELEKAPTRPGTKKRANKQSRRTRLTGPEAKLYDTVETQIKEIAAGEEESTEISVSLNHIFDKTEYSAEELGVDEILIDDGTGKWVISEDAQEAFKAKLAINYKIVVESLLADMPYELYWFDKSETGGYSGNYNLGFSAWVDDNENEFIKTWEDSSVILTFYVSVDYSKEQGYYYTTAVDKKKTAAAAKFVRNSATIITGNRDLSDTQKLAAYKAAICNETDYNDEAADEETNTLYGDPWQLIWVFDGDKSTNVVCEGYAKAFQFLCDQSTFSNNILDVYTVTGVMNGGEGSGNHMWNIVHMPNGLNYMADITNSDSDSIGYNGTLFMSGALSGGSLSTGYRYDCTGNEEIVVSYTYDEDTRNLYSDSELLMSESDFDGNEEDLELENAKTKAKEEINKIKPEDYDAEDRAEVQKAKDDALAAIDDANDIDTVNKAVNQAKSVVASKKTSAQKAAEKKAADEAAAREKEKADADVAVAKAKEKEAASNINKGTVTAADIKKASDLGATTVTLGASVKKISKNAFKGTGITTIVVKTKKLKAKAVKGSLKGSKVKTVKVQVGSKKVNKKYVKKYKKFFTKKNAGKKAKVK